LARYYLATFTLRLQKFAGKAPNQNNPGRGLEMAAVIVMAAALLRELVLAAPTKYYLNSKIKKPFSF